MWLIIIILVVLLIFCYIFLRVFSWIIDVIYHHQHPERKRLNKKVLKTHLITKHGKGGKKLYKEFKRILWRDYKIR